MKKEYILILTFVMFGYWQTSAAQNLPGPGDLVITEIMANPEAVSDADGEWIEIFNSASVDILLNGLIIKDSGSNKHTLANSTGMVIKSGEFWVLVKEKDVSANGGINGNYQYSNFTLGNSADQIILTLPDGTVIDQVVYGEGWPLVPGASMELDPGKMSATENDQAANWRQASYIYGSGDKGSPGSLNASSSAEAIHLTRPAILVYPNPTNGQFTIQADFPSGIGGCVSIINPLGQIAFEETFTETRQYTRRIDRTKLASGLWFIKIDAGRYSLSHRVIIE